MKRIILSMVMAALAILFVLEISMEQIFVSKRQETAETMADIQQTAAVEEIETPEIYALFGVDAQEGEVGRSDCILLLSLEGNTLRMCSLARDTMVTIAGTDTETKLGHAYALGGPEGAMETINENFGLDITEYTAVNFDQLEEIVDLLGGVEVPLTQEEWNYMGLGQPYLGTRRLSGEEALTYCRIRSIDNDDMRTGRQRTLITAMLSSVQDMPRSKLPELAIEGMKMCRTNLTLPDILRLGKAVMGERDNMRTESLSIPGEAVSAWGGNRDDGVWYYVYDLERASEVVHDFFYGSSTGTAT